MAAFPINEAQITGLFVESIAYGMHLISSVYCVSTLVSNKARWKRIQEVNLPMLLISLILLANATFDVLLGFYHTLKAFIFFTGPGGPTAEFTNISDWINVSKSLTVVVQTMIGDAILIYRCWVIYGQSFRIIFLSLILWLGCFGSTIWVIFLEATLHSRVLVSASQLLPAGTTFWGLTIALNVITTSLLIWRLWGVDKSNRRLHVQSNISVSQNTLRDIMRIIVESGLLYTAAELTSFVTFVVGSNAVYVATDAEIQVVGIAFNLIIIRAARLKGRIESSTVVSDGNESRTLPLRFMPRGAENTTDGTRVHVIKTQYSSTDLKVED